MFENPDEFILGRENIGIHLGFGRGRQRCVGSALARLAVEVVVRTLLRSISDFEVDEEALEFARMPEMGIICCPTRFVV